MRRLLLLTALLLCGSSAFAQLVTITQTLTLPDGSPWSGTITITWPNAFIAGDGSRVGPSTVPIQVNVVGGAFSVQLYATTNATPITQGRPVYYTATYSPILSRQNPEVWVVPYSRTPISVSQVQASGPPTSSVINPTQISTLGATTGECIGFNGSIAMWGACGSFTGILSLNGLAGGNQTLVRSNDTNVTLTITDVGTTHTFTMGWQDRLAIGRGGTGTNTQFTPGSLVFAGPSGVYSQDNPNLFYDSAQKCIGIGTTVCSGYNLKLATVSATPAEQLIVATGAAQAGLSFSSNGAMPFQIGQQSDGTNFISDGAHSRDVFDIIPSGQMDLMPIGGNIAIGGVAPADFTMDVQRAATSGNARFYSQGVSGITGVAVRAGAAQSSNPLISFQSSSGALIAYVTGSGDIVAVNSGFVGYDGGGLANVGLDGNTSVSALRLGNNRQVVWSSTNYFADASDTGLCRNGAGVLEVNNGTCGQYRDLILRNLTINNLAGGGYRCLQVDNTGLVNPAAFSCGSGGGATIASTTNLISGDGGGNGGQLGYRAGERRPGGNNQHWRRRHDAQYGGEHGVKRFPGSKHRGSFKHDGSAFSYDTTNKMPHFGANSVDNLIALLPSSVTPSNGDCVRFSVAGGVITLTNGCSFTQSVSAQTTVSISAATHGKGTTPVAFCFNNASPAHATSCGDYTRDGSGNMVFAFSPAFTGTIQIEP